VSKLGESNGFFFCLGEVCNIENGIKQISVNLQRLTGCLGLIFQLLKSFLLCAAGNHLQFEQPLNGRLSNLISFAHLNSGIIMWESGRLSRFQNKGFSSAIGQDIISGEYFYSLW